MRTKKDIIKRIEELDKRVEDHKFRRNQGFISADEHDEYINSALSERSGLLWVAGGLSEVYELDENGNRVYKKMEREMELKGLVIRHFDGGYFLCDGKPPTGCEDDGEIYVGNAMRWFKTWEEAERFRQVIDRAYGM
jgi:hypothetical protein